jgi:hypothetical protein
MENNMQEQKMTVDDAMLTLAASVVERTRELITDGWVKGALTGGFGNVQEFCVHGAMGLALQEVFGETGDVGRVNVCGGYAAAGRGYSDVEALATAFIVDEAKNQYGFKGSWEAGAMAAAPFNDDPATKHEDVLSVLDGAAKRLWSIGVDWEKGTGSNAWTPSKWADTDTQSGEAQQFLYATLA